jgi:hypothetical protein
MCSNTLLFVEDYNPSFWARNIDTMGGDVNKIPYDSY